MHPDTEAVLYAIASGLSAARNVIAMTDARSATIGMPDVGPYSIFAAAYPGGFTLASRWSVQRNGQVESEYVDRSAVPSVERVSAALFAADARAAALTAEVPA